MNQRALFGGGAELEDGEHESTPERTPRVDEPHERIAERWAHGPPPLRARWRASERGGRVVVDCARFAGSGELPWHTATMVLRAEDVGALIDVLSAFRVTGVDVKCKGEDR